MQKTRLGISAGMLAAAIYLSGLFSGYWLAIFLAGYVLLFEANQWLKISAVKAVCLMMCFSFLTTVINLVPNVLDTIADFGHAFGSISTFSQADAFFYAVIGVIDIIQKIVFLALGLKALNQGAISLPVVDKLISKYMLQN